MGERKQTSEPDLVSGSGRPWGPPPFVRRGNGRLSRWLIPVLVALFQLVGTAGANSHEGRHLGVLAVLLLLAGPAALVLRCEWPVAVLIGVVGITVVYLALDEPHGPFFVAAVVALFSAVLRGHLRMASLVVAAIVVVVSVNEMFIESGPIQWSRLAGTVVWPILIVAIATAVRNRRLAYAEAKRMYEQRQQRRVSDERLRIARELHDVLAHNISLINVQAGVALHLLDDNTEQARIALGTIKQASKDTLREMRSVLGVLRQVDEDAPLAPASGLARLDQLVADWRSAGFTVNVEKVGTPQSLPTSVDQAAYRIIQEALTNVTKHSAATTATVTITYGKTVIVRVDDDGPARTQSAEGTGNGLPGMMERAAALGGELVAVAKPGGGFRVSAHLPVGEA